MRLLVRCSSCERQFDATGQEPGFRFHCHCGVILTVQRPQDQISSVVRCEACGGAREGRAAACQYCGGDFTLHERDLHTMCPACLARVSDKARFCHHCGNSISADQHVGSVTEHPCPVCLGESMLGHRSFGNFAVLECGKCAGLWVGHEVFSQLAGRAKSGAVAAEGGASAPRPAPVGEQAGPMYRKCVVCDRHMQRRNYGRTSGVIVDICKDDGIWFDAHELDAILSWLRSGGWEKGQEVVAAERASIEKEKKRNKAIEGRTPFRSRPTRNPKDQSFLDLIPGAISSVLFD